MTRHAGTVPIKPFADFLEGATRAAGSRRALAVALEIDERRIRAWTNGQQQSVRCETVDRILVKLGAVELFHDLCPPDQISHRNGMTIDEKRAAFDRVKAYTDRRAARSRARRRV